MGNTISTEELYTTGTYLEKNPLWHTEESPWKAEQVLRMLDRQKIVPKTICEVGCGAGEVLKQLQQRLNSDCGCSAATSRLKRSNFVGVGLMRNFSSFSGTSQRYRTGSLT
jgi:tRNA U55 pseudouridine synthase TruB